MKLCEHLKPYYKREIAAGNEVYSVTVGGWSNADYIVDLESAFRYDYNHIENKNQDVEYFKELGTSYSPPSQILICKACKIALTSPLSNDQQWKHFVVKDDPHQDVIATNDDVSTPDDLHRSRRPTIVK